MSMTLTAYYEYLQTLSMAKSTMRESKKPEVKSQTPKLKPKTFTGKKR